MKEKTKRATTTVAIRMPNDLREKLLEMAERDCRTLSSQMIFMLRVAVEKEHEKAQ